MKRFFITIVSIFFIIYCNSFIYGQSCQVIITSESDPECILTSYHKDDYYDLLRGNERDCLYACQGSTIEYYAEGEDIIDFVWVVQGAASFSLLSDNKGISITWGTGEAGEISVTVTTSEGVVCTETVCVYLVEVPVLNVSTVPEYKVVGGQKIIEVCLGEEVFFMDHSDGGTTPITGYYWESMYGTAASQNYSVYFNTPGETAVKHTVWNECGCISEEIYYIKVMDGNPLTLSCFGAACGGSTVEYTALGVDHCSEYSWDVEGGTIISTADSVVKIEWGNPESGYGIITLDGNYCDNLCSKPLTAKIPLISSNVSISGPEVVCVNFRTLFEVPLWGGGTYEWTSSPLTNVTRIPYEYPNQQLFTFREAGTYVVKMKYIPQFLECDTIELYKTVEVRKALEIVSKDDELCKGSYGQYVTNNANLSVFWEVILDGQVVHSENALSLEYTFLSSGSYKVMASHLAFCNKAEFLVNIKENPPAIEKVEGDTMACLYSSILLESSPTSSNYYLSWESICDEGERYSGNSVTISYADMVCDVAVYQIDAELGCRSEAYIHTVVPYQLQPHGLPDDVAICAGQRHFFSVPNEYPNVLYEWSIIPAHAGTIVGNANSHMATVMANRLDGNPSGHTMTVRLKRTFCTDSVEYAYVLVNVSQAEAPILVFDSVKCVGDTVVFQVEGGTGIMNHYIWTINGINLSGPTVSYAFSEPGYYPIKLSYRPIQGCDDAIVIKYVNIMPSPVPTVTVITNNQNIPQAVAVSEEINCTYQWYYNGTPLSVVNSICPVSEVGIYCCEVTNIETACSEMACAEVGVISGTCEEIPLVATVSCTTATVQPENPSLYPFPITWSTDRVNAPVYTGSNASFDYSAAGYFHIYANAFYQGVSYCGVVDVNIDCVPDFDVYYDCLQGKIIVRDQSQYRAGINIPERTFRLSGGGITPQTIILSENQNVGSFPIISPTTAVQYTVTMHNLTCTSAKNITINPPPVNLSIDAPGRVCQNTPFELTGSAEGGNIVRYSWNFNDGSGLNMAHCSHTYQMSGNKTVTLTVMDRNGCQSSVSRTIIVSPNDLIGNLAALGDVICAGDERIIEYSPAVGNSYYHWLPENIANQNNQHATYQTGNYTMKVVSPNGCIAEKMINVAFLNKPEAKINGKSEYCAGEEVKLIGNTGNENNYEWVIIFPNASEQSFTEANIVFEATMPGNYTAIVRVNNGLCESKTIRDLKVHPKPAPPILGFGENSCIHTPPVVLEETNSLSVYWSNGTHDNTANYYVDGVASAYYLDTETGCKSRTGTILISPLPNFDGILSGCYERCSDVFPFAFKEVSISPLPATWTWYRNDSVIASSQNSSNNYFDLPVHDFGNYQLACEYTTGCTTYSSLFTVMEADNCSVDSCDVSIVHVNTACSVSDDCEMYYTTSFRICNNGNLPFSIGRIYSNDPISPVLVGTWPNEILPGRCETITVRFLSPELSGREYEIIITNREQDCEVKTTVPVAPESCLLGCGADRSLNLTPAGYLGDKLLFDFEFVIWSSVELMSLTTESPVTVLYDSTYVVNYDRYVVGRLAIDVDVLEQMRQNGDSICFDYYLCLIGKPYFCVGRACGFPEEIEIPITCSFTVNPTYKEGCRVQDCVAYYETAYEICNNGTVPLYMSSITSPSGITPFFYALNPNVIQPGTCELIRFQFEMPANNLTRAEIIIYDAVNNCSIPILLTNISNNAGNCFCDIGELPYTLNLLSSTDQGDKWAFQITAPSSYILQDLRCDMWNVLDNVTTYSDNNHTIINGTLFIVPDLMNKLIESNGEICLYYTFCVKGPVYSSICTGYICIPVDSFITPPESCCKLFFDVKEITCSVVNCELVYSVPMTICNDCKEDILIDNIVLSPSLEPYYLREGLLSPLVDPPGLTIEGGKCIKLPLKLRVVDYSSESGYIVFSSSKSGCSDTVHLKLDPYCIKRCDIKAEKLQIMYDPVSTTSGTVAFDVSFSTPPVYSLVSMWSDPPEIIDYDMIPRFSRSDYIARLEIDYITLVELIENKGYICINVVVCPKAGSEELCFFEICIPAEKMEFPHIEIVNTDPHCFVKGCNLYYRTKVTFCNRSNAPFYLDSIQSTSLISNIVFNPFTSPIDPEECRGDELVFQILDPSMTTVYFTVNEGNIAFTIDLTDIDKCISNPCKDVQISMSFKDAKTDEGIIHYYFEFLLGNELILSSITPDIGNIHDIDIRPYNATTNLVTGIFSIEETWIFNASLKEICFHIIICNKKEELCTNHICIPIGSFDIIPEPCCDLSVDIGKITCSVNNCEAVYSLSLKICNYCKEPAIIDSIILGPSLSYSGKLQQDIRGLKIPHGECISPLFSLKINDYFATGSYIIVSTNSGRCLDTVYFNFNPSCIKDCSGLKPAADLNFTFNATNSTPTLLAFNISFITEPMHSVLAVWSDFSEIIDYEMTSSSSYSFYDMTLQIDDGILKQLVKEEKDICIMLLVCPGSGSMELCRFKVCFPAKELLSVPRIEVVVDESDCDVKECNLFYTAKLTLFNSGTSSYYIKSIRSNSMVLNSTFTPATARIDPGRYQTIVLAFQILDPTQTTIDFIINDDVIFLLDLNLDGCFFTPCQNLSSSISFKYIGTNNNIAEYDFNFLLDKNQTLLDVFSNAGQINNIKINTSDKLYNSVTGTFSVEDKLILGNKPSQTICFYIIVCDKVSEEICMGIECHTVAMFRKLMGKAKSSPSDDVLSMTEKKPKFQPYLIPNPATHEVRIEGIDVEEISQIELWSLNGQKLYSQQGTSLILPIGNYSQGTYIIRIIAKGQEIYHLKLIKQ